MVIVLKTFSRYKAVRILKHKTQNHNRPPHVLDDRVNGGKALAGGGGKGESWTWSGKSWVDADRENDFKVTAIQSACFTCWGQEILVYQMLALPGKCFIRDHITHRNNFSTWGVSVEQVVSREELETERGCEESSELVLPSLDSARSWLMPLWHGAWCHLGIIWCMKPQRWKMVWGGHHGRTEGGWARHFPRPEDDWFDLTISWSCMKFEEALNIYTSWNWPRLHRGGRRVEGGSRGRHSSAANTRVQGEMFFSDSVSLRSVPMYELLPLHDYMRRGLRQL